MNTVLIAGGSGLIGQRLSQLLVEKGFDVIFLSRQKKADKRYFQWDAEKGTIDSDAIKKADYVVNLAGAGIVDKPWTKKRKEILITSRTKTAALLERSFKKIKKPKAYLSASAIGYYGNQGDEWLTEESASRPEEFLSEVTIAWEQSAKAMMDLDIRTAIFRIGIVLSTKGGALPEIMLPMKFGANVSFGDGSAYYPWIHIDDVCKMFIWGIENKKIDGIFNATAPQPMKIKDLVNVINKSRGGFTFPFQFPAPSFALRLAMGERADMLLNSARVSSEKISKNGFEFSFPEIENALGDILKRKV